MTKNTGTGSDDRGEACRPEVTSERKGIIDESGRGVE